MKHFSIFLMSIFIALNLAAQTDVKKDVILKLNGDELSGKVTEIGDADLKFVYSGETLIYSIKKSEILKITYASGRVEFYNKQQFTSEKESKKNDIDHHNRAAILPFAFITDNQSSTDEMSYKVQTECYTFLSKHAGGLTILDPRTTNALLIKAGVTRDKMMGFTMDELCSILGVEYIIDGTITQNKGTQSAYQNENYKASSGATGKNGKTDARVSGSSSSTITQNYETSISMNIYTDTNKNIFSEDRKSFWSTNDAYKASLQYLLKRTSLYTK